MSPFISVQNKISVYFQCFDVVIVFPMQPREGSHIWKMHMVKSREGLGIQITGGRGSRRSPHGIIIAHMEDGGAIHRYQGHVALAPDPGPLTQGP